MKKFFLFLLLCLALQVQAQGNLPGGFKHIIDVARYSDWGKGYLTITDSHIISLPDENYKTIPLTFKCLGNSKINEQNPIPNGWLVLEVDGESAKGWTPSQFYSKVDNRHDVISLKVRKRPTNARDTIVKIQPIYELPSKLKPYASQFSKVTSSSCEGRAKRELNDKNKNIVYNARIDSDFDFFTCKTYDYLITSDNPLLDKSILNQMAHPWYLTRDEKNPDIIFTIARNANESINTTYVPPTSRTVNVGSKTTTRYNHLLERNEYITTQKNRTITEGGYTQETKTTDLFLEIAALDAKRINDPKMTHAPVVWQATTKRHVINANFDYDKELENYASWYNIPPEDRIVSTGQTIYAPLGVTYDKNDPKIITAVEPDSRAEKIGLRPGDKLLKAEDIQYGNKDIKKRAKESGWRGLVEPYPCDNLTIKLEIQRGKEKMKLVLEPLSLKVGRTYWTGGE